MPEIASGSFEASVPSGDGAATRSLIAGSSLAAAGAVALDVEVGAAVPIVVAATEVGAVGDEPLHAMRSMKPNEKARIGVDPVTPAAVWFT